MPNTRRSRAARTFAGLPRLAALMIVASGIGASQSMAWQRDSGTGAVRPEGRFLALPAPLQEPLIPVLPGGVVGPKLDAGSGGPPAVPPPAETVSQAVESQVHLTGPDRSDEIGGDLSRRRIGIALGLIAIVGIGAIMAAVRGTSRR